MDFLKPSSTRQTLSTHSMRHFEYSILLSSYSDHFGKKIPVLNERLLGLSPEKCKYHSKDQKYVPWVTLTNHL